MIDAILHADENAPPKQRHTAAKIYRRLQTVHCYPGSNEDVRLCVLGQQRGQRETLIPLDNDPGQRLDPTSATLTSIFPKTATWCQSCAAP